MSEKLIVQHVSKVMFRSRELVVEILSVENGPVRRYVNVADRTGLAALLIPIELAPMLGGDYAWVKEAECPCDVCGQVHKIKELEGVGTCPACYEIGDPDAS